MVIQLVGVTLIVNLEDSGHLLIPELSYTGIENINCVLDLVFGTGELLVSSEKKSAVQNWRCAPDVIFKENRGKHSKVSVRKRQSYVISSGI